MQLPAEAHHAPVNCACADEPERALLGSATLVAEFHVPDVSDARSGRVPPSEATKDPTARQSLGDRQVTALSFPASPPAGNAISVGDPHVPDDSTRTNGLPISDPPTAVQEVVDGHETALAAEGID